MEFLGNNKSRRSSLLSKAVANDIRQSFDKLNNPQTDYDSKLQTEISAWGSVVREIKKENETEIVKCDESILLPEQKQYIKKGLDLINEYLSGTESFAQSLRLYHEKRFQLEELKMQIYQQSSEIARAKVASVLSDLEDQ